jgi:hypothetical protein
MGAKKSSGSNFRLGWTFTRFPWLSVSIKRQTGPDDVL